LDGGAADGGAADGGAADGGAADGGAAGGGAAAGGSAPDSGAADGGVAGGGTADAAETFTSVFAIKEFRALWLAQVLSVLGDQLARVALTLLVYDRTRSALLAALTFAASVLPTFVGGVALAGLADRLPRRQVMIACDLIRMVLVLVMIIPGLPLVVLGLLLFAVTMVSTPFTSARAAMYPDILAGRSFELGTAVTLTTYQFAQVVGFAGGGTVVGLFGVRPSLLADAATFAFSALLIRLSVRSRPAPRPAGASSASSASSARRRTGTLSGVRLVFGNPALRTPMLLGWLAAFYNAPEGIAAPLARALGAGAFATGLILASEALGASAGAIAFTRLLSPSARAALMRPLAIGSCLILVPFLLGPSLPVALLILFLSGLCDCFQVAAVAAFVRAAPDQQRSQVFGLAQAGMSISQGVAMALAGLVAQHHSPSTAVAIAGVLGTVAAALIVIGSPSGAP
jgi:predicted MFS family arabinose efflux permease